MSHVYINALVLIGYSFLAGACIEGAQHNELKEKNFSFNCSFGVFCEEKASQVTALLFKFYVLW